VSQSKKKKQQMHSKLHKYPFSHSECTPNKSYFLHYLYHYFYN